MRSTNSSTGIFESCFMDNFTEPTPEQIERDRLNEIAEFYGFFGYGDNIILAELREKYNRSRAHLKDMEYGTLLDAVPDYVQYCILCQANEVPKKYTREPFARIVDGLIDFIVDECQDEYGDDDCWDEDLINMYITPFCIAMATAKFIEYREE